MRLIHTPGNGSFRKAFVVIRYNGACNACLLLADRFGTRSVFQFPGLPRFPGFQPACGFPRFPGSVMVSTVSMFARFHGFQAVCGYPQFPWFPGFQSACPPARFPWFRRCPWFPHCGMMYGPTPTPHPGECVSLQCYRPHLQPWRMQAVEGLLVLFLPTAVPPIRLGMALACVRGWKAEKPLDERLHTLKCQA